MQQIKFNLGDRVRPTEYDGNPGVVFDVQDIEGGQIISYQCFDHSKHVVKSDQIRLDTETTPPVILIDQIKQVMRSYPEMKIYDMSDDKNIPDIIDDLIEFAVINGRFENADRR